MIYDTSIIDIITVTKDPKFGDESTVTNVGVSCMVEDTNRIIKNSQGKNEKANSLIMIDPKIAIKKGDRIIIKKQFKAETGDDREYEVKESFITGGFSASHREVLV